MTTLSKDFLRSVLDNFTGGIICLRPLNEHENGGEFESLYVNRTISRWSGIPQKNLIGKSLESIIQVRSGNDFERHLARTLKGEEPMSRDYGVRFNGQTEDKWFRVAISRFEEVLLLEFQEITELKEAEEEAEWQELKYRRLFDESMDAIFIARADFTFLNVNAAFQSQFGYSKDALRQTDLSVLFPTTEGFEDFKIKAQQDEVNDFDVELLDQSGKKRFCIFNVTTLKEDATNKIYYLGVIRDVTKRRQAETQLLRAEKLTLTGKIARTIAHEVRNPLTNLNLALEQLKEEVGEDIEDAELYFNIIERNANRISTLISDLLNSSKPKQLDLLPHPIKHIVSDAVRLVEDRLQLKGMQLKENYSADLPLIMVDADQMKTALLNLMVNAVEAMRPDEGILTIDLNTEDRNVNLRISDNGRGISPEHLKQLFEPFFTGKKTGTGLGLTAVQNIIHSHNGQIEVESEVEVGTTFVITLPGQV